MAAYATYEEYAARYGEADRATVTALLEDAAALIGRLLPADADLPALADVLRYVSCAAVSRALPADGIMPGVTDYSEGAGGLTASVKLANPSGDIYLTATEKAALGIGGGRVGACDPWAVAR